MPAQTLILCPHLRYRAHSPFWGRCLCLDLDFPGPEQSLTHWLDLDFPHHHELIWRLLVDHRWPALLTSFEGCGTEPGECYRQLQMWDTKSEKGKLQSYSHGCHHLLSSHRHSADHPNFCATDVTPQRARDAFQITAWVGFVCKCAQVVKKGTIF